MTKKQQPKPRKTTEQEVDKDDIGDGGDASQLTVYRPFYILVLLLSSRYSTDY